MLLFMLKIRYQSKVPISTVSKKFSYIFQFVLLRGNRELNEINGSSGFKDEIMERYKVR